jgi:O-antigen/teichoic acid export membrane protein
MLAMLSVALLYRSVPSGELGYWFFFQTIFLLVDTFRGGFLQVALIKFYTGTEPKRAANVIGSIWFLATAITLIVIGINLLFLPFYASFSNEGLLVTIKWIGITFLVTLPSTIAGWILQADLRFDKLMVLRIVGNGSFILAIIVLMYTNNMNLNAIFLSNVIINIITSFLAIVFGWSGIIRFFSFTKQCIFEIFHFGKFSVGTTIASNLLRSSDTFIITYMLGSAALSVYNLVNRLMELIEIPLRSTLATAMSSIAQAYNRNNRNEMAYILQKYAGTLTLALIPVSIIAFFFADLAVSLLGGGKYIGSDAANMYRIFMLFAMFYPVDRFIAVTLDMVHKPQINLLKVIIMLLLNIAGDIIGISVLGNLYGVAISTVLPLCFGMAFGYYHLRKEMSFKFSGIFIFGYIQIRHIIKKYSKYLILD